jgi:hypothetical protein
MVFWDVYSQFHGRSRVSLRICVIDGQGGGIGATVIKRLKEEFGESFQIWALGTNAIATTQMMKAGANRGASGENAIVVSSQKADVIIGPIGIVLAQAMMGEVTPAMAAAVASAPGKKFLLPLTQENVEVAGVVHEPLPHLVDRIINNGIKEIRHV